ncbi:hypothetical protein LTR08_006281 [Meristemomyces frigidus]|nr:hypothetical protein LTR08_006281 [Meristemomyces frigidus]
MALSSIPDEGITLHGVQGTEEGKHGSASAVLFKLNDGLLQSFRKASQTKEGLQFVAGSAPKLRIGSRTIDLSLSPEAFRTELYASTAAGSLTDLAFAGVVSHRAEVKQQVRKSGDDTAGSDAALAALQSSMASYEKEKQANQSNIVNSVLPTTKSRSVPGKQKRSLLGPNQPPTSSPSSVPRYVTAPPSASNSDAAVRLQALKTPVIHLLSLKPASRELITSKTHIPKDDLEDILQKIAKQQNGKWHLGDRAYRELDVWKFGYTSQDDRQVAIDNCIRAYDRLRIDKEDKLWQQLLPKEDRGKGIVLSRLNAGGAGQVNRGLTPNYVPSPLPQGEAIDSKPPSAANTPRLGASTPRPTSAKGDVMKRLLSKDPKKARAMEEAKEKKRKERQTAREATASDRESAKPTKPETTAKVNAKVKSAAVVHSSDDESGEEGEVKEEITRVDSRIELEQPKVVAKPKPATSGSLRNSDAPTKAKTASEKPAAKPKVATDPAKSIASLVSKAATPLAAGKSTPRTNNGLTAPTSQHTNHRSPQKADSRPNVPSPLGAARPRLASDISDRSGVQRARPGAGTPFGLGITNGTRKRQDTVTSMGSTTSSGLEKKRTGDASSQKPQKTVANGTTTAKASATNGAAPKAEHGVKRKPVDKSSGESHADAPAPKHRKTESTSSQSQKSHASSTAQSTGRTSPAEDTVPDGGSSDNSAVSVLDAITYIQGVTLAEKFRDVYYPAYALMYDAQAAKEAGGEAVSKDERERLWLMHRRLEQMKREIRIAAEGEHRED